MLSAIFNDKCIRRNTDIFNSDNGFIAIFENQPTLSWLLPKNPVLLLARFFLQPFTVLLPK